MRSSKSDFTHLLEHLRISRGFDFSGYKVSSLVRRVQKRMAEVGVSSYGDYSDYLEVHPDEFQPLFNTVLINVTGFFRDPAAWEYLAEEIVPRFTADASRPVRVWSAGCATGEEAYTIAMLLAEQLGDQAFRDRVKIYATDADDDALVHARQGGFEERHVQDIPPALREKYFEPNNGRFVFRTDLRRTLIFGRHDLVQDAAISRVDLLICRNTLMYFNVETQARILARFHFALNREGYLFLGKAETLLTHGTSFRPVDLKRRVFQRAATTHLRDRLLAVSPVSDLGDLVAGARHLRLRESAFDHGPVAQLVLDRQGHLVLASAPARRMFSLGPHDLGRLLQDLELSYRPVELRSHIDEAYRTRVPVRVTDVPPWAGPRGEAVHLEIQITPLIDDRDRALGVSLAFLDHTQARLLRSELERANQELETAYEELQSANEELETTNEELQSTVEELETTNEELQSANEELETMNEELQSTNEELRTMNDQLQQRTIDLNEANGLLGSILAGLRAAVVVLGRGLDVEVWSQRAEDLWGLRSDEVVGSPFLELEIGIPVEQLAGALQCSETGTGEIEVEGVNRRGKPILCRISCTRLHGTPGDGKVLLLMEEIPLQS